MNRLTGDWTRHPFVVVQNTDYPIKTQSFSAAVQLLVPDLFGLGRTDGGVVLLTPRNIVGGSGLHFLAMANTVAQARQDAQVTASMRVGMRGDGPRE